MEAKAGDIFCTYNKYLKKYTAVQITRIDQPYNHKKAVLLPLNWTGDNVLTENDFPDLKPLYKDFMYWNRGLHLSYVDPEVPGNYIFVGNTTPFSEESTSTYKGSWGDGYEVYCQIEWEKIPQNQRNVFKEAVKSKDKTLLGDREININTASLSDEDYNFNNADELSILPCLSSIHCVKHHEGLYEYLQENPFLTKVTLEKQDKRVIDFRGTHIKELIMYPDVTNEIYLNDTMEQLSLPGFTENSLIVHAYEDGKQLQLNTAKGKTFGHLSNLSTLQCSKIDSIDMEKICSTYPNLRELYLHGAPGIITNFSATSKLPSLEVISVNDLFGFAAEDIPHPEQFPKLYAFWMSSVPEDAAKEVKKLFKSKKEKGFNLSVEKPRKAEWLQQNLHNPFREWDGEKHISAAQAKKAADLYKKARKEFLTLLKSQTENSFQGAQEIVRAYTEGFNKLDRRTQFIETVEREEIFTALCDILTLAENREDINIDKLLEIFNDLRDF